MRIPVFIIHRLFRYTQFPSYLNVRTKGKKIIYNISILKFFDEVLLESLVFWFFFLCTIATAFCYFYQHYQYNFLLNYPFIKIFLITFLLPILSILGIVGLKNFLIWIKNHSKRKQAKDLRRQIDLEIKKEKTGHTRQRISNPQFALVPAVLFFAFCFSGGLLMKELKPDDNQSKIKARGILVPGGIIRVTTPPILSVKGLSKASLYVELCSVGDLWKNHKIMLSNDRWGPTITYKKAKHSSWGGNIAEGFNVPIRIPYEKKLSDIEEIKMKLTFSAHYPISSGSSFTNESSNFNFLVTFNLHSGNPISSILVFLNQLHLRIILIIGMIIYIVFFTLILRQSHIFSADVKTLNFNLMGLVTFVLSCLSSYHIGGMLGWESIKQIVPDGIPWILLFFVIWFASLSFVIFGSKNKLEP